MSTVRGNIKFVAIIFIVCHLVHFSHGGGLLNFAALKNSLLNWTSPPNACAGNSGRLLSLVNLVCSTAQALNSTARDACYGCFARFVTLPQGQQQLVALSLCANIYFIGTSYQSCATRLNQLISGNVPVYPSTTQCSSGYCEFVQCLRRTNSNNLITQCSNEVRDSFPINITVDTSAVRYFTNVTSCILAKARCSSFNPITGELQMPGVTTINNGKFRSQVPVYNSLQIAPDATLRLIAFPGTTTFPSVFCSAQTTLSQSTWTNNEC